MPPDLTACEVLAQSRTGRASSAGAKFDRGEYVGPWQQTAADFFADWLKATEHTVRESTFESHSRNVKNRLRVVQTVIQTRSKVLISGSKTSAGRRPIALDKATVAVLREHRKRMLEERLLIVPSFNDHGLVFQQPEGQWLKPDAVSTMFFRRVKRYELPRLTLHGLCHTWATLALERGIRPRVVQERFGHPTISITLGMYSHVGPTLHGEAASQIAALLL